MWHHPSDQRLLGNWVVFFSSGNLGLRIKNNYVYYHKIFLEVHFNNLTAFPFLKKKNPLWAAQHWWIYLLKTGKNGFSFFIRTVTVSPVRLVPMSTLIPSTRAFGRTPGRCFWEDEQKTRSEVAAPRRGVRCSSLMDSTGGTIKLYPTPRGRDPPVQNTPHVLWNAHIHEGGS